MLTPPNAPQERENALAQKEAELQEQVRAIRIAPVTCGENV
jgi:hypothetical protein